jgi:hypothetical protein
MKMNKETIEVLKRWMRRLVHVFCVKAKTLLTVADQTRGSSHPDDVFDCAQNYKETRAHSMHGSQSRQSWPLFVLFLVIQITEIDCNVYRVGLERFKETNAE